MIDQYPYVMYGKIFDDPEFFKKRTKEQIEANPHDDGLDKPEVRISFGGLLCEIKLQEN